MDVLIGRQVNLSTQAVHPVPGFQVLVIALLVTHMRIYEEDTGKGQGESKDTQYRIGGLPDQVFEGDGVCRYVSSCMFLHLMDVHVANCAIIQVE